MRPLALALVLAALAAAPPRTGAAPLWPLPLNQTLTGRTYELDARRFRFVAIGADSDVLRAAFERYEAILFGTPAYVPPPPADGGAGAADSADASPLARRKGGTLITSLRVYVAQADQSLNVHTDESHAVSVAAPAASIQATTVFGAVRALETFAQLVDRVDDGVDPEWGSEAEWGADEADWEGVVEASDDGAAGAANKKHKHRHHHHRRHRHRRRRVGDARFFLPGGSVWDEPAYAHRGALVDTARHYLPVPLLTSFLDAMAASKLNVLHWHATDDAAFSVDVPGAPELAARGGGGRPVYSAADVAAVVAAARDRGVRVIPEVDSPSHTASWGGAYPGALADCYGADGAPLPAPGPLDPSANGTYSLLWRVLRGTSSLFPESKLHVGGDEPDLGCWASNAAIVAWATQAGHRDMAAVFADFVARAVAYVTDLGRDAIVWQEAFEAGAALPPRTEVGVWRWWSPRGGSPADPPDPAVWRASLDAVTKAGHRAILSAPWYLNLGQRGDMGAWRRLYAVDPRAGVAPRAAAALVIGGEASLWGEMIDASNLMPTAWPAAAAVGERLWSGGAPAAADDGVAARLATHVCRLRSRGLAASPLGPGYCPSDAGGAAGVESA